MAKKHDLTPQEKIAISGYFLTGDLLTAYALLHPNTTANKDSLQRQAVRWLHKPDCATYLNDIRAAQQRRIQESHDTDTPDLTDRETLLQELQRQYGIATDVKTRTDILARISDICKMKQTEKPTEEENLLNFYLPQKCYDCPYKKEHDERAKADE